MIDLRNNIKRKEIPERENLKKVADIIDIILNVNKQQKDKGRPSDLSKHIGILTPKQMFPRSPIALAQVKAGNTSENLLNEIRQITYFLYREKKND